MPPPTTQEAFEEIYGTAIDGAEVEEALLAFLRQWVGPPGFTYLAWAKQVKDSASTRWTPKPSAEEPVKSLGFKGIRSYSVVHLANEKWPEDQLPMLLAYSRGLASPPKVEGDGTISGAFVVVLTAISSGQKMADAKALARLYATAARGAITQHPDLASELYPEGFGGPRPDDGGVIWADHQNFQISKGVKAERNLMGVSDTYVIGVGELLNLHKGGPSPLDTPDEVPDPLVTIKEGGAQAETGLEPVDVAQSLRDNGFFREESP